MEKLDGNVYKVRDKLLLVAYLWDEAHALLIFSQLPTCCRWHRALLATLNSTVEPKQRHT